MAGRNILGKCSSCCCPPDDKRPLSLVFSGLVACPCPSVFVEYDIKVNSIANANGAFTIPWVSSLFWRKLKAFSISATKYSSVNSSCTGTATPATLHFDITVRCSLGFNTIVVTQSSDDPIANAGFGIFVSTAPSLRGGVIPNGNSNPCGTFASGIFNSTLAANNRGVATLSW